MTFAAKSVLITLFDDIEFVCRWLVFGYDGLDVCDLEYKSQYLHKYAFPE